MKPVPLRVLLVTDHAEASRLKPALPDDLIDVVAEVAADMRLPERVAALAPDVILIESESPQRDMLEQICVVTQHTPRPIVMFTDDGDQGAIQAAIQAGVAAYVVDGITPKRIEPILQVAIARFESERALRRELDETRTKLAERKLVEQAKGILMTQRGLSEPDAYQLLRKSAMDQNVKVADLARQLVSAARLLL